MKNPEEIPDLYYKALNYVFEEGLVPSNGLWLEFGVYAGGTINRIARCAKPGAIVYGFDSFEGLPGPWVGRVESWDLSGRTSTYGAGTFSLNGILPKVAENVRLVKGWYKDSLPAFLKEHPEPVAFIHVDSDIYSSARDIFDNLKTRICNGCVIVFDELVGYPNFEGHEWKAWWEFVEANNIAFEWIGGNRSKMIKAKEGRLIFDRDRSPTENVSPSHENVAVRIISNPSQRSNLIRRDPFLSTRPSHEQPQYDIANIILGYFPQNYVGTLLEVGSAHPVCISVSLPFRNLGWKIISVEPIPEFCEEFKKRNFKILEYAASGEDIGPTTFKVSPDLVCSSSLSIKSEVEAIHFAAFGWTEKNFKSITVQAFTLNTILQRHCPEVAHIDAMIVDTEGWELEVMKGFDLIRFNPKVVCLENFQGKISYRQYMKAKGYEFDTKEIQDEFFLKVSEGQIS